MTKLDVVFECHPDTWAVVEQQAVVIITQSAPELHFVSSRRFAGCEVRLNTEIPIGLFRPLINGKGLTP